ncbi:AbiTii domain-containing protein [Streptomyces murinus]|uniref:AbiTii domain-containing protein n=1 Tax=Streptomyces murinus TaxID=33900 RepID=UPI0038303AE8
MTTPDVQGLQQLERAVLDDGTSLATALRQCPMLAGYAQHAELRAWALKELEGYAPTDELPSYRKVPATLEVTVELNLPGQIIQGNSRRISPHQLPQHARDRGIGESAPIRQGVREIEAVVTQGDRAIRLSPPGSAEYALQMTQEQHRLGNEAADITSLH